MGTTLTYMFYAAGLILALLPIVIDFIAQKRNPNRHKKPKWYIITVVIIAIFLLGVGGFKVHVDAVEKTHTDSLQNASKTKIDTLNANVKAIQGYLTAVKDSDKQFEEYLFDGFKIKRNKSDNRPIVIGNMDNRHTNNTHINKADNVDIH